MSTYHPKLNPPKRPRGQTFKAVSYTSSVRASIMCEPPHGSATLGMPDSSWMIIWVFLAMRALFTVGRPRASSKELVWRDCVPPNTAAMASTTVRITLLYGSWRRRWREILGHVSGDHFEAFKTQLFITCSVRDHPEVWQWVRRRRDLVFSGWNFSFISVAHNLLAARNLAISM